MSADFLAASNAGSWAGSLSELWVWCVWGTYEWKSQPFGQAPVESKYVQLIRDAQTVTQEK